MKKLLVTLSLSALVTAGFAQGTVNFGPNAAATNFRTNALAAVNVYAGAQSSGVTAIAPGGYYYEVLTAPSTAPAVDASLQALIPGGAWSDTGLLATNNTSAAGRMNGGAPVVAANWPGAPSPGQSFIIVGWSAQEGTTWAQVAAKLAGATFSGGKWTGPLLVPGGFLGATIRGNAVAGAGTTPAFSLFSGAGTQGTGVTGTTDLFVIDVVPEPSTFALIGLGSAALLIFRRRK